MNRRSARVSVALLLVGVGCASFRVGNLPPQGVVPASTSAEKPSISVVVSGRAVISGEEQGVPVDATVTLLAPEAPW